MESPAHFLPAADTRENVLCEHGDARLECRDRLSHSLLAQRHSVPLTSQSHHNIIFLLYRSPSISPSQLSLLSQSVRLAALCCACGVLPSPAGSFDRDGWSGPWLLISLYYRQFLGREQNNPDQKPHHGAQLLIYVLIIIFVSILSVENIPRLLTTLLC